MSEGMHWEAYSERRGRRGTVELCHHPADADEPFLRERLEHYRRRGAAVRLKGRLPSTGAGAAGRRGSRRRRARP